MIFNNEESTINILDRPIKDLIKIYSYNKENKYLVNYNLNNIEFNNKLENKIIFICQTAISIYFYNNIIQKKISKYISYINYNFFIEKCKVINKITLIKYKNFIHKKILNLESNEINIIYELNNNYKLQQIWIIYLKPSFYDYKINVIYINNKILFQYKNEIMFDMANNKKKLFINNNKLYFLN